jgi:hypothetical protein
MIVPNSRIAASFIWQQGNVGGASADYEAPLVGWARLLVIPAQLEQQ